MKKFNQKAAIVALSALIGGGALLPFQTYAASLAPVAQIQKAALTNFQAEQDKAIQHLIDKGVLQGYSDGKMRSERIITNAEFIKMVLLALEVDEIDSKAVATGAKWYDAYLNSAATKGLIENVDTLSPSSTTVGSDMASLIAKALQRDVKSVQHWMNGLSIGTESITRGETAMLLVQSEKAIRSENAEITSIKALNKLAFEVTFNAPLTQADEAMATASANFVFDGDLKLVNQPRLKTGSIATYIVPVQTMKENTTYTLKYKSKQPITVAASNEIIQLNAIRQVTADTFEIDSLRSDGVIDYGYLISAYAGGRGANAAVLDENNKLDGKAMQVIPSLASRQATLIPEGGEPITVSYVGFTQSTDGKQEPKFRLPQGTTLQAGKKYTVSSPWFNVKEASFIAETIAPLTIASTDAVNETTLNVTLSQDPGDELFAYRSIQLKGSDGSSLTAQYKVQTRKGAVGVFEVQNSGKLVPGVTYEITPVGTWAVADKVSLTTK
ncbi:S-layer homology domain-containing protein [Paenibacillus sp. GSMTC-2017]|uniref:S-layer homology domain-containing protein n=1 Tax=Paenibacillus sp. GSMTC-2017 TaxID=2794350 RepID=UPI0018D82115|nr:S-layer homology domain-containing protein [Paenibacillus sp. GSMTC-2017]MBH5317361.1 S-layer homology domain-containing protein [Paenibacillus sp. GSMTC-2017]